MTTSVARRRIEQLAMAGIVSGVDSASRTSSLSLASHCTHLRNDAQEGAVWPKCHDLARNLEKTILGLRLSSWRRSRSILGSILRLGRLVAKLGHHMQAGKHFAPGTFCTSNNQAKMCPVQNVFRLACGGQAWRQLFLDVESSLESI